jgi:hypothetical protein
VKEFYPPFDVRVKQLSSIELGTSYYSKNLSATDILEFAMVDNEQYSRIPELTNNFTEYSRAIDLAKLSANDYQVLKKRGLTTNITNPYVLSKIAEISDEAWNNLDKRGIKELCPDNYIDWACLGELSDDEFQIAKDKNLFDNRGTESNPLYLSGEEIAKLVTTLDDNDWDNFEKRGLFKDYKRVFSGFKDGLAQYNDLLILAKMPDSEFEKFDYLQRNVPMNLFTSTSIELVKLNDKEFQRLFDRDLFQYLNRFESYDNYSEDAPILTTLSKLEDKDYETFKEKYLYNPMETIQSKVMALTLDKMKISDKEDISELSFKQKRQYLDVLLQKSGVLLTKDFMKHYKSSSILPKNIDEYIDLMSKLVESVGASSKPLDEVTKTEFFNSLNELSAQGSEFRNLDLAQDGFKLEMSYPRDKFISDVSNTISDLNMNEKLKVFDYYGFELQNKQNGEVHLSGYPHSYQSEEKLAKIKDPKTREVISQLEPMIKDFTDNNKILPDGKFVSGSMAKTLNGVFKALPELYTTVGKVQHGVHDYTIDIHSLSVLQKCMNISDFDNFSDKDKRIIMISALLHDITKEEHEIDKSHPANSSFDSYYILEKFNLPKEEQMSIYQLIKNHDMLEHCNGTVYDTKLKDYRHINDAEQDKIVQNYAYELHTGNLAKLETVFTKADLLSVKKDGSFYNKFADACDVVSSKLEKSIHKIKASSIFLPQTKIPTADKIKTDGKNSFDMLTYDIDGNPIHNKLIKLSKGLDLHQYGFDEGVNADNFNVLIHGFDTKEQQTILDALDLVDQKALLSASYVVYNKGNYHAFRQQGFIKNIPDDSIGAMYFRDFGSGCKKDTDKLVNDYINGGQSSYRNYLPKLVKSKLNLTDDEYIKLYEEIKDKPMDVIEKERPEVAKAFNQIFEEMETKKRSFGRDYNEGLVTKGIPTAVYYEGLAKNSSSDNNQEYPFEDIPEFLRKYAEENNIPIIYFGK